MTGIAVACARFTWRSAIDENDAVTFARQRAGNGAADDAGTQDGDRW